jgi:uncharacterized membrane protein
MTAPRRQGPGAPADDRGTPERWISVALRAGVGASVALLVLGTLLSFVHHPEYLATRAPLGRLTRPGTVPHALGDVLDGLRHHRGQALVTAGLLVLIATPVARVALSIAVFARQRDRVFVAATTVVLGLLLLSFVLGRAGG